MLKSCGPPGASGRPYRSVATLRAAKQNVSLHCPACLCRKHSEKAVCVLVIGNALVTRQHTACSTCYRPARETPVVYDQVLTLITRFKTWRSEVIFSLRDSSTCRSSQSWLIGCLRNPKYAVQRKCSALALTCKSARDVRSNSIANTPRLSNVEVLLTINWNA